MRRGDYLGRIAARAGVTVGDLRRANKLSSDVIRPGQKLRIPDPFRRTRARDITWHRPFKGRKGEVLRAYGTHRSGRVTLPLTGTDIAMPVGTEILSPANGVLRYAGEQEGYGHLLIIEHGAGFATVLGPCDPGSVQVPADSFVLRGQVLARCGEPAVGGRPYLHVELRLNRQATNPRRLLQ